MSLDDGDIPTLLALLPNLALACNFLPVCQSGVDDELGEALSTMGCNLVKPISSLLT
jgi:hypothetical protein